MVASYLWLDRNKPQDADKVEEASKNAANPEKKIKLGEMTIPKYIIRVTPGYKSLLFFVEHPEKGVYKMDDLQTELEGFQTEELTVLWEPGDDSAVVRQQTLACIVTTMSPDIRRYKEFGKKGGQKVYLPCPSELQLQWMGIILRSYALKQKFRPSVERIHERIQNVGPYIRQVLIWTESKRAQQFALRNFEITNLREDQFVLKLPKHIEINQHGKCSELSHRLAYFTVNREHDRPYGYSSMSYKLTCKEMLIAFGIYYSKMNINELVEELIKMNNGTGRYKGVDSVALEHLFEKYYREIHWKSIIMSPSIPEEAFPTSRKFVNFETIFIRVEQKVTTYSNLCVKVLYYPDDPTFPLVDFYCKGPQNSLIGIQATIAKRYAKNLSVYHSFYERLGVVPNSFRLHLYYLILPMHIDSFDQGPYNHDRFIKNATGESDNVAANAVLRNTTFYALLPPESFANRYPPENLV